MGRRSPGEGSVFYRPDRKRWIGQVQVAPGERKTISATSKADALRQVRALSQEVVQGSYADDQAHTVESYFRWWLEQVGQPRWKPGTYRAHRGRLQYHVYPVLGPVRLAKLTPAQVQRALQQATERGLAPRTVSHVRAVLREGLGHALRLGLVHRNVAVLTEPPSVPATEITPLSPAASRQFIAAAGAMERGSLWILAATTGLRQGELLGLHWAEVNLEARVLTVRWQLQRQEGEYRLVPLKTRGSRRVVALPELGIRALLEQARRQAEWERQAGERWQTTDLVFTRRDGWPLNGSTVTHQFQQFLKAQNLPPQRFHDLRHLYASLLLASGAQMKEVSAALGHSQIGITLDTYAHLYPEASQALAARLDRVLGLPSPHTAPGHTPPPESGSDG